jgi:hypothetical protein
MPVNLEEWFAGQTRQPLLDLFHKRAVVRNDLVANKIGNDANESVIQVGGIFMRPVNGLDFGFQLLTDHDLVSSWANAFRRFSSQRYCPAPTLAFGSAGS